MHSRSHLALAFALPLAGTLASPARPQQTTSAGNAIPGNPIDRLYVHDLIDAETTDVAVGEATNDLIPDVIAVMGGKVELVVDPLHVNIQLELPLPKGHERATACATHTIQTRRHADAVAPTDRGLVRWIRNDAEGSYAPHEIAGSTAWTDASQLVVTDVDGDGRREIVGLFAGAGRTTVRVGSLSVRGLVERAARVLAPGGLSVHAIDADAGSPGAELAVLFADAALYLSEGPGGLSAYAVEPFADRAVCAAVVEDARGPGLAVVHTARRGGSQLGVYRPSGAHEPRIPLGSATVREIATGEVRGGAGFDLVLVSDRVRVFENTADRGSASFAYRAGFPTQEFEDTASGRLVGVALADFDGDGDADLYVESEAQGRDQALAQLNPAVIQNLQSPAVQITNAVPVAGHAPGAKVKSASRARAELEFGNLEGLRAMGMTHVLVELWLPGRAPELQRRLVRIGSGSAVRSEIEFPTTDASLDPSRPAVVHSRGVALDVNGAVLIGGAIARTGFDLTATGTGDQAAHGRGENDPNENPPPPGNGHSGTPGSGTPPGGGTGGG